MSASHEAIAWEHQEDNQSGVIPSPFCLEGEIDLTVKEN
jgi:hypothetical protein